MLWNAYCFLPFYSSIVLSVDRQRWSPAFLRVASSFADISLTIRLKQLRECVQRSFEAYNGFYQFVHQQCCLLVTKVNHNVISASQVFSLTSFWQFASSNFVNSVLRSFEAYNVYYHFIHRQWYLLVTKDGHNLLYALEGFSKTSFQHFASSNFVNSVLRSFEAYNVYHHFIHQQCCLLVTKDGHNLFFASQVFCWHLSDLSVVGTSWMCFTKLGSV